MSDLKLDSDHDIYVGTYDLELVESVEVVSQDVLVRLQFFLGEWFLDTRLGVPYFEKILGHKPRLTALKELFRKVIVSTPGMIALTDFLINYEGTTRTLPIQFVGQADSGTFEFNEELIIP